MVSVLLVVAIFSFAFVRSRWDVVEVLVVDEVVVAVVSVAVTGDNFAVVKKLDIVLSVVGDSEAVDE